MSAVLKEGELAAVHDARARLAAAEARVSGLTRRLDVIEARANVVRAARSAHSAQVTQALLEGHELPAALAPQPIEPGEAVRVVKAELQNAEEATRIAASDLRVAQVRLLERRRDAAVMAYRAALANFQTTLREVAALDRIAARALNPALPSLFLSRLAIPALPREDSLNGLALEGRSFFGSPLLAERELQLRRLIERDAGPLPF